MNLRDPILHQLYDSELGLTSVDLANRLDLSVQEVGQPIEDLIESRAIESHAGFLVTQENVQNLKSALVAELEHSEPRPPSQTVLGRLNLSDKQLDRLVQFLCGSRFLRSTDYGICLNTSVWALAPKEQALLERVATLIDQSKLDPPPPHTFGKKLNVPPQATNRVLQLGIDSGQLVALTDQLVVTRTLLDALPSIARESLPPVFTVGDFKKALGLTRRTAVPYLEYLDSTGQTMRNGETRSFTS